MRTHIFNKQTQRIDIDEASVRKALSRISADICESKPIEEYKQLFSSFVERVDVFEDYVTIVLKDFDMINIRVCNGSGAIKEEPPLDLHQMVVWNGGAEGNRLHFLPVWEKIIVWRRQADASGAHPHRIYHSIPLVLSTMPILKATL